VTGSEIFVIGTQPDEEPKTGRPLPEIAGIWPEVTDPAALLGEIAEWLGGYGNRATRRTYAEGLGLPVSPTDLHTWGHPSQQPTGWASTLHRYAQTLGITAPPTPAPRRRPPPAPRGHFRSLHWFRWCAAHGLNPLSVRSAQVKTWLDDLADAGAAVATRDRMLATVKTLYTHLADAELVTANPAALDRRRLGLTMPADHASATVTLTTAQVRALYETAGQTRRGVGPLDAARALAVVTLFTLGLRVSELSGLDRADLHITRGRRALRVHGKGGKTRIVYLSTVADTALSAYLRALDAATPTSTTTTAVRRDTRSTTPSPPLIVTRTGHRYQRQALWQLLRRLAAAAGDGLRDVAEAMHPHALRHFYVTTAVEAGAQLVHVQADVGHTSIDTTEQVYNSAARDPSRSAVDLVAAAFLDDSADQKRSAQTLLAAVDLVR
jgi:site-specific recombinase XerD